MFPRSDFSAGRLILLPAHPARSCPDSVRRCIGAGAAPERCVDI